MIAKTTRFVVLFLALYSIAPCSAQTAPNESGELTQEINSVPMPSLEFDESAASTREYGRYFYFYRPNTDFATALSDILECRELVGRSQYRSRNFVFAGPLGNAVVSGITDAIWGSAERRRQRVSNMRRCMSFKEYGRYGLSQDVWERFNFEEGDSNITPESRVRMIRQQALVASSAHPQYEQLSW